jgi:hypothetical protein
MFRPALVSSGPEHHGSDIDAITKLPNEVFHLSDMLYHAAQGARIIRIADIVYP